jgi:hypothetical protein
MTMGADILPDEMLYHMGALMDARQLVRMGAICRRFRCIARDQRLWRRLFIERFAHKHTGHLLKMPVPTAYDDLETWPDEARLLYEHTGARGLMPPRCLPVEGISLPLARAFAVGKDWQWLYLVHAREVSEKSSGPGYQHCGHKNKIIMGDWIDGAREGYGTSIKFHSDGTVAAWRERFKGGKTSWSVRRTRDWIHYRTKRFAYIQWESGGCAWRARGPFTTPDTAQWKDATDVRISTYSDGSYVVKPLKNEDEHGIVRTVFPNGDIQTVRYIDGKATITGEFMCSPRCPDGHFAGKTLEFDWSTTSAILQGPQLIIPLDCTVGDGRLFHEYIQEGYVVWYKYGSAFYFPRT